MTDEQPDPPVEEVASVALGSPPAGLLRTVDASKTPGGKTVPPEEAATRAEIRNIATAGAAFTGGVIPLAGAQGVDKRALAGALVSGGAFLPFVFGGGLPGGTSPAGPGGSPGGPGGPGGLPGNPGGTSGGTSGGGSGAAPSGGPAGSTGGPNARRGTGVSDE
ncbi:MAG: hypothetical protein O2798_09220 [Chloroflexi bacterium]|nr:hypothetical protein [Chloroflexota bacterium]